MPDATALKPAKNKSAGKPRQASSAETQQNSLLGVQKQSRLKTPLVASEGQAVKETKEKPVLERVIQKQIIHYLQNGGCAVFRMNSGMTKTQAGNMIHMGVTGTPDLLVCMPYGRIAWVEVKNAKGKVTDGQQLMHDRLRSMGYTVIVARDAKDVAELICDVECVPFYLSTNQQAAISEGLDCLLADGGPHISKETIVKTKRYIQTQPGIYQKVTE